MQLSLYFTCHFFNNFFSLFEVNSRPKTENLTDDINTKGKLWTLQSQTCKSSKPPEDCYNNLLLTSPELEKGKINSLPYRFHFNRWNIKFELNAE